MEPVIARAAPGLFMPFIQGRLERTAAHRSRKIEYRCGAAKHRGFRAGHKIIRSDGHAKVKVKMRMRIDKPREYIAARSIHHLCAGCVKTFSNGNNFAVLHQNIRFLPPCGVDYQSVFNNAAQLNRPFLNKKSNKKQKRAPLRNTYKCA